MHLEQIATLCDELDIIMHPLPEKLKRFRGMALSRDGIMGIGWDDDLDHESKIFTIAHEIAHCVLHFKQEDYKKFFQGLPIKGSREPNMLFARELEADIFGAVFTAMCLYRKAVTA